MNEATAVDSERALLSALLNDPEAMRIAGEIVTPVDFADPRNGALYNLLAGMKGGGLPVDPFSVSAECAKRGGVKAGYPDQSGVHELYSLLISSGSVRYHATEVRNAAVGRQISQAAYRAHQAATQPGNHAELAATVVKEFTDIRNGFRTSALTANTLGEVLSGPDDYDWVIPGLLEKGDRFMLTGSEGAGKTYFMRQMAVMACAGLHPVKFGPIDPVDVLVIDAENSERQWRRNTAPLAAKAAHYGARDPREHLRVVCSTRLDITSDRHLGAVHRLIDEHNPQILVIGPLYKLVPRAITNDDDAAPLITALDSLRDRGLVLLMEAHAGHGQTKGGERDLRPRGSSALLGWPEFGYGLSLDRDQPNVAHLQRWRGDRDAREWPESLMRGGEWPWTDLALPPGSTARFRPRVVS